MHTCQSKGVPGTVHALHGADVFTRCCLVVSNLCLEPTPSCERGHRELVGTAVTPATKDAPLPSLTRFATVCFLFGEACFSVKMDSERHRPKSCIRHSPRPVLKSGCGAALLRDHSAVASPWPSGGTLAEAREWTRVYTAPGHWRCGIPGNWMANIDF
jgi:hypothetical protein